MPIYEYECTECDHVTEAIQKFSDRPLTRCKSCGGKLHKLISHSSFHLKGSGWYVTDYAGKKDSGTKPPAKKKDSSPTSDTKTSSKGDSDI
jgi:putative FmdB family regulatory protein